MAVFHHSAGAVVVDGERVLALQRADNRTWIFPKGHLEQGEDAAAAAVREVREETGLDIELLNRVEAPCRRVSTKTVLQACRNVEAEHLGTGGGSAPSRSESPMLASRPLAPRPR